MSTEVETPSTAPQTHAILDKESRGHKAKKIEVLTRKYSDTRFEHILEVGCGSGFITSFFSQTGLGQRGVHGVDVADERQIYDGYTFHQVSDTVLPFEADLFDFAISNHVVEHVGPPTAQAEHLAEIYRCMEPGGTLYFAVPNKWRLVEPHYRLPLLSWLPKPLADGLMRMTGKGPDYDCRPWSMGEAKAGLKAAGFEVQSATLDAIPAMREIEGGLALSIAGRVPRAIWWLFLPIMPTLIYVCRKPAT